MGIIGDLEPDATYEAVGRALSSWEDMETGLAYLYSIFIGHPLELDRLVEFGDQATVFSCRLVYLRKAGLSFFIGHPDQDHEGAFKAICNEAESLALSRHRIAHGCVRMVEVMDLSAPSDNVRTETRALLKAPWYAIRKLKMGVSGALDSSHILTIANQFIALQKRIAFLIHALGHAPSPDR